MDATTFRFLISLAISGLDLRLMDVVIAFLYGPLDNDIYMKLLNGFKLSEAIKSSSQEHLCIKLNKSLYGFKKPGSMWYNRLSEYLLKEGYKNDPVSPYADYLSDPHNGRSQAGYVFTYGGTAIS
ncbi:uncharacterized protein LOC110721980 [Chenopodium quinoa]|uniref:uncharacterized protein LOC110721980 n=1 Tax=Chenopodium quinoa TaxID=63459 RepID=UPI000B77BC18|nr:uncharacterized protein LOC110721980 [Chenopodium quinoa]